MSAPAVAVHGVSSDRRLWNLLAAEAPAGIMTARGAAAVARHLRAALAG